jgi:hypothetical protein
VVVDDFEFVDVAFGKMSAYVQRDCAADEKKEMKRKGCASICEPTACAAKVWVVWYPGAGV